MDASRQSKGGSSSDVGEQKGGRSRLWRLSTANRVGFVGVRRCFGFWDYSKKGFNSLSLVHDGQARIFFSQSRNLKTGATEEGSTF